MPASATPARNPISTWVGLGDITLKFGRPWRRESDAHPHLNFAQSRLSYALADFGMKLEFNGSPPILRQRYQALSDECRENLQRLGEIPLEEMLWCVFVLNAAYTNIRFKMADELGLARDSLDNRWPSPPCGQALPAGVGTMLPVERVRPDGEPREEYPWLGSLKDDRLAFNIVAHIHADSELNRFFRESLDGEDEEDEDAEEDEGAEEGEDGKQGKQGEQGEQGEQRKQDDEGDEGDEPDCPPPSFKSPDWPVERHPSTWGFEFYATDKWAQSVQEWSGRPEETILKQAVFEACEKALVEINRAKKALIGTFFVEDEAAEHAESMRRISSHPQPSSGLDLASLPLHGNTPTPTPSGNSTPLRAHDPLSRDSLLASDRRGKDPAAFVQQLPYEPGWKIGRGPPGRSAPAGQAPDEQLQDRDPRHPAPMPPDGKASSVDAGCDSDSSDSGCSTPRASTPVPDSSE